MNRYNTSGHPFCTTAGEKGCSADFTQLGYCYMQKAEKVGYGMSGG
jgi:hypothetical protein